MLKVNHRFDALATKLKAAKVRGSIPKHLSINHSPSIALQAQSTPSKKGKSK